MYERPKQYEIADALGVTPGRVSQLKADGMPCDSIEAAEAWFRRRVDVARSFGQRHAMGRRPAARQPRDERAVADEDADGALSTAAALGLVYVVALAAADRAARGYGVDAALPALRSALADVPAAYRRFVALPLEVWSALYSDAAPPALREFVLLAD